MVHLQRTDSSHPDFIALIRLLDLDLAGRDGKDTAFYSRYNKIAAIKHAIVAYYNGDAVASGAIREYQPGVMEVKRMFTVPDLRGKGLASKVLAELEGWAKELGYTKLILETGKRNTEAVSLYLAKGYQVTPNYEPYVGVDNSVCFVKLL
ncbi:GNAT family N-acetyltransferase [Pseudobacter ginsenosidimutans]|jgi:GNAT superfamily N-acetyltransferase|uniref:Acetyltransferase (GNAT) family protein n=1 Tax=Pseudobacter ginsenosidimutans TaxID=661488 RepID=A0A4Q7N434_9BACT|nr:GNAT family N-acetyltransferase [Pseudobacter ginsenosidimutans]QEC44279.1 GNAT family N-acetyltransferase [Pseudobacter ginsenosidimutans]RZS75740.1 acetyltransferase (GNAT) family protein [Pseudobacter ginsenosidimutans]